MAELVLQQNWVNDGVSFKLKMGLMNFPLNSQKLNVVLKTATRLSVCLVTLTVPKWLFVFKNNIVEFFLFVILG